MVVVRDSFSTYQFLFSPTNCYIITVGIDSTRLMLCINTINMNYMYLTNLTIALKMTPTQVVKTSVSTNNSPQDYTILFVCDTRIEFLLLFLQQVQPMYRRYGQEWTSPLQRRWRMKPTHTSRESITTLPTQPSVLTRY